MHVVKSQPSAGAAATTCDAEPVWVQHVGSRPSNFPCSSSTIIAGSILLALNIAVSVGINSLFSGSDMNLGSVCRKECCHGSSN